MRARYPRIKAYAFVVEARGVEPLSENPRNQASPSAVCVLGFPLSSPRRQGHEFGSFIKSGLPQSLSKFVPRLNDAGLPRRGRLGADVRGFKPRKRILDCSQLLFVPLMRRFRAAARFLIPQNPRRNQIRPHVNQAFRLSFICRSISRLTSLSRMSARLSYCFLPLHTPSSSFIRLSFK